MLFAAYDVLLNKRRWRDRTPDRRDVWAPIMAPADPTEGGMLARPPDAIVSAFPLDRFGAYPFVMGAPTFELGANCWPHRRPDRCEGLDETFHTVDAEGEQLTPMLPSTN
jgi:hypothetical protein